MIRRAKRTLTGLPATRPVEVVLGVRPDGSRGVTLHGDRWRECWPFDNPALLDALGDDVRAAAAHMRECWPFDNPALLDALADDLRAAAAYLRGADL